MTVGDLEHTAQQVFNPVFPASACEAVQLPGSEIILPPDETPGPPKICPCRRLPGTAEVQYSKPSGGGGAGSRTGAGGETGGAAASSRSRVRFTAASW